MNCDKKARTNRKNCYYLIIPKRYFMENYLLLLLHSRQTSMSNKKLLSIQIFRYLFVVPLGTQNGQSLSEGIDQVKGIGSIFKKKVQIQCETFAFCHPFTVERFCEFFTTKNAVQKSLNCNEI